MCCKERVMGQARGAQGCRKVPIGVIRVVPVHGTRTYHVSPHTRSPFAAHKTLRDYMSDHLLK